MFSFLMQLVLNQFYGTRNNVTNFLNRRVSGKQPKSTDLKGGIINIKSLEGKFGFQLQEDQLELKYLHQNHAAAKSQSISKYVFVEQNVDLGTV